MVGRVTIAGRSFGIVDQSSSKVRHGDAARLGSPFEQLNGIVGVQVVDEHEHANGLVDDYPVRYEESQLVVVVNWLSANEFQGMLVRC